jgi:hypothetical protein
VGRKLGELWKALSEEDKKAYSGEPMLQCSASLYYTLHYITFHYMLNQE